MLLTTVNESLELVTGANGSVDWTVSWADHTTTLFTPGSFDGNILVASTTTLVGAPVAATQRQVKLVTIINRDPLVTQTITLQKNTSGNKRSVVNSVPLLPNEMLEYIDGQGLVVLSPFAVRKISSSISFANTTATPYFVSTPTNVEWFQMMIVELRLISLLLQNMSQQNDDLDVIRKDLFTQL